eukprot:961044_1
MAVVHTVVVECTCNFKMVSKYRSIGSCVSKAQSMVQAANKYFKANTYRMFDVQPETENDESERIPVGSYCYVDCETVYGVVIGHLPDDQYSIIDLFEKRQRKAFGSRRTVITDEQVFNQVDQQYHQYLKPEEGQ